LNLRSLEIKGYEIKGYEIKGYEGSMNVDFHLSGCPDYIGASKILAGGGHQSKMVSW
jgi:hypothetical protein